jgi:hypothetical protein
LKKKKNIYIYIYISNRVLEYGMKNLKTIHWEAEARGLREPRSLRIGWDPRGERKRGRGGKRRGENKRKKWVKQQKPTNRCHPEDIQIANKHPERCPISLAISKKQTKIIRYCYIPIRMTKIKKSTPDLGEDVEKLGHSDTAGGQMLQKNSSSISYKTKHAATIGCKCILG